LPIRERGQGWKIGGRPVQLSKLIEHKPPEGVVVGTLKRTVPEKSGHVSSKIDRDIAYLRSRSIQELLNLDFDTELFSQLPC